MIACVTVQSPSDLKSSKLNKQRVLSPFPSLSLSLCLHTHSLIPPRAAACQGGTCVCKFTGAHTNYSQSNERAQINQLMFSICLVLIRGDGNEALRRCVVRRLQACSQFLSTSEEKACNLSGQPDQYWQLGSRDRTMSTDVQSSRQVHKGTMKTVQICRQTWQASLFFCCSKLQQFTSGNKDEMSTSLWHGFDFTLWHWIGRLWHFWRVSNSHEQFVIHF